MRTSGISYMCHLSVSACPFTAPQWPHARLPALHIPAWTLGAALPTWLIIFSFRFSFDAFLPDLSLTDPPSSTQPPSRTHPKSQPTTSWPPPSTSQSGPPDSPSSPPSSASTPTRPCAAGSPSSRLSSSAPSSSSSRSCCGCVSRRTGGRMSRARSVS